MEESGKYSVGRSSWRPGFLSPAWPLLLRQFAVLGALLLGVVIGMLSLGFLLASSVPQVSSLRRNLGLGSLATGSAGQQTLTLQENSAAITATEKVMPAVVAISARQEVADFFGRVSSRETGGGSGFILSADGLIATNRHVVEGQADYQVVLNDGRIFDATIQAVDTLNDLAFLKISASGLPTVELGSSDGLKVGQEVLAVGNALGEFENSVTTGVVSGKQRSITAGSGRSAEQLTGLIQTDAAINPGNSGGPLVNLAGQVVGINTAIASTGFSSGNIGIGFAIPIDSVRSAIQSVQSTGKIVRPQLGVRYVGVDKSVQSVNNLSVDYGALVSRGSSASELAVLPGSAADKAGIKEGDIILKVNDDKVAESLPLSQLLQKYAVGEEVSLTLQRQGQEQVVKATLAAGS